MSSSEDLEDGVTETVVAIFAGLDKEERQEILSELLSRYCPECGDGHASCGCEISDEGDFTPDFTTAGAAADPNVDLNDAELEEQEEEIDGSLEGLS
jgi:hypothetical protein